MSDKPDELREVAREVFLIERAMRLRDEAWMSAVLTLTPLWENEKAQLIASVNARMAGLLKAEGKGEQK